MAFDWRSFETRVKRESWAQGIPCVKVPDHMFLVMGKPVFKKTEFDFCASVDGVALFFDCKCMAGGIFNLKSYVLRQEKIHQWLNLKQCSENLSLAGYLIYFYDHRRIVWASVPTIKALMDRGDKAITLESPGLITQSDDSPICLRDLVRVERAALLEKLQTL